MGNYVTGKKNDETFRNAPLTDYFYTKASRLKIPLSGTFELLPTCNFSCRMCYVRKSEKEVLEHSRPGVDTDGWLKIAEAARKEGMLFLLLTGGEPFLYKEFGRLYEQLYKMGLLISINTNGSLIDDEIIELFSRMPPKRINITLYGASDETYEALCRVKGGFYKVDQVIRRLRNKGISLKLNGTLTPYNIGDLEAMVSYARSQQLLMQTTVYMFPPIRKDMTKVGQNERFTPEEAAGYQLQASKYLYDEAVYKAYLERLANSKALPYGLNESCVDPADGKVRCRAGSAAFWVTWDGYMTPCGMMPEPKVEMTGKSFADSWKELNQATENLMLSGTCRRCSNREICHACAAIAMAETGNVSDVPRYLCDMTRELKQLAEKEMLKYAD